MIKTFTASILALSIAFTSVSAVPAQAGKNDDLGRLFAGAVTLFIISKAIENNKKSNRPLATVTQRRHKHPPLPTRQFVRYLPEQCFFRVRTRRSARGVYGKICLREFMRRVDWLPQACQDTIRVRYGRRADVYDAECLRRRGYQVAGWRR